MLHPVPSEDGLVSKLSITYLALLVNQADWRFIEGTTILEDQ